MSQSQIINKIKQTQQAQLSSLTDEIYKCGACKKNKQHLFFCQYDECDQFGRMLCERCGLFLHDDEADHEFDKNSNYIHEISKDILQQNDPQNQTIIKQQVKEIHYMVKSMEEEKTSSSRTAFETIVTYGPQVVNQLTNIKDYVPNEVYWKKSFSVMRSAFKNRELKSFANELKTALFDVGDFALEQGQNCQEGAIAAAFALVAIEFCYHTFRLIKGDISLKTYGKKLAGSIAMATGAAVGNIGGSSFGAAVGTYICPGVGTAVGAAIGGLLGAIFVGAKAKQSIEDMSWFNDKNEQQIRHQLIKEALDAFGFTWKQLKDKTVFEEANIARRYRLRAKEAHPDRDGGSHEAFHKLNAQLSILLALLEQDDEIRKETSKQVEAITYN